MVKMTTHAMLVAAISSLSSIGFAASAAPAAILQTPVQMPHFPKAWVVKSASNENTMDLEDGSVSMLGAVRLKSNALLEAATPEAAAQARARAYFMDLMGKDAKNVTLTDTGTSQDGNEITTYMVQTVDGVKIEGTYATASMVGNTLKYARHFLVQAPAISTTPAIAESDAQALALEATRPDADNAYLVQDARPELAIVFNQGQGKLAYSVQVKTEKPWELRAVYVDAQTGEFLSYEKLSHDDVSGHVNFSVEMGCVGDQQQEMPVPYVKWNGKDYADSEGAFTTTANVTTARVSLESPYFRMLNKKGRLAGPWTAPLVAGADNDILVKSDRNLDQLDPFYHLHMVRNWVRANVDGPNNQTRWTDKQVQVNVNLNDTCNAYYDGTLNFFSAGDGCLNTARTAGIVYHEYGHGIHHHSPATGSGISMDGQVSEGVGDYVAATLTNNPNMRGIFSCRDNFRSCVNKLTYCERGCNLSSRSEVHDAGQVIAAVWWEFRGMMVQKLGRDEGVKASDRLFLKFLAKVGNMTSAYQAAIAADDDTDGNPANGTVHSCELNRAFANDASPHFPRLKGYLVPCNPSKS